MDLGPVDLALMEDLQKKVARYEIVAATALASLETLCTDPTLGAAAQGILVQTLHGQIFVSHLALSDDEKAARLAGDESYIVDELSEKIAGIRRECRAHPACDNPDCVVNGIERRVAKARADSKAGTLEPFMFVAPAGRERAIRDLIADGDFHAWQDAPKLDDEPKE